MLFKMRTVKTRELKSHACSPRESKNPCLKLAKPQLQPICFVIVPLRGEFYVFCCVKQVWWPMMYVVVLWDPICCQEQLQLIARSLYSSYRTLPSKHILSFISYNTLT